VYIILNSGILRRPNSKFLFASISVGAIGIMAIGTFIYYFNKIYSGESQIVSMLMPGSDLTANNRSQFSILHWIDKNMFYLSIAWISGFIVYSIKLIGGLSYLGFIKKNSILVLDPLINKTIENIISTTGKNKRITILFSEKILSPVTFGLYRVSIVLPLSYINQLAPRETEIILAHEIAHIIRYDFLINLLVNIVKTFFYFHPGLWYLTNVIDNEREKATDLLACAYCDSDTVEYARVLVKAQELSNQKVIMVQNERAVVKLALPFFKPKKQLLSRIENILGENTPKNLWLHRLIAFGLFIGIFALLSFTPIMLPRSGSMVHPAMEGEALSNSSFSSEDKYESQTINDSLTVEIRIEVETEKPYPAENIQQKKTTIFDGKEVVETETKVELETETDQISDNNLKNQDKWIIRQYLEQQFDSQEKPELDKIRRFRTRKEVQIKIAEELKSLDTINYLLKLNKPDEFFILPSMDEHRSKLDESVKLFRERAIIKDSLLRHGAHRFYDGFIEDLSWHDQLLKTHQPGPKDSIFFRFMLDGNMIDKLKMEGPPHFEKFRYGQAPSGDSRSFKIIYLAG
jgi:beta-lactamase regulating signal transducer with metallopeptidase domain